MGVPQKWLVSNRKSIYKWIMTRGTPILGNLHMCVLCVCFVCINGYVMGIQLMICAWWCEICLGCFSIPGIGVETTIKRSGGENSTEKKLWGVHPTCFSLVPNHRIQSRQVLLSLVGVVDRFVPEMYCSAVLVLREV